ncbi:hypothetical protein [Helicovermis profundi]
MISSKQKLIMRSFNLEEEFIDIDDFISAAIISKTEIWIKKSKKEKSRIIKEKNLLDLFDVDIF